MNRVLDYLRVRSATLAHDADAALLDRFVSAHDEPAFAELVRRHGPVVWGACRRMLADVRDAEDAFQATFLVLVRRAAAAREPALGPWLYKVAALTARNLRRGNRRRAAVSGAMGGDVSAGDPNLSHADLRVDIDAALLGLSEKGRAAVILCHLQGFTRREAAARLGCPEGTLSAILSRALAKLRARLADRDPALALAVAGGLAAPPAVAAAAVRAAVVYTTATGAVSPAVWSASEGTLRMFRLKKLWVAAGVIAAAGLTWLAVGPAARTTAGAADPPRPAARGDEPPTLKPGKWVLSEWLSPHSPRDHLVLTIAEKDGKPAITAVEDDSFNWQPKGLTVAGRRITFTITREGPLNERFDGLFDPADPKRVLGSLWSGGTRAERAVFELAPPGGAPKPRKSALPAEWQKYIELTLEHQQAEIETDRPGFKEKPTAEQARLRAAAAAAREKYFSEVPKLFRKLVADRPDDPFGYEAVMELFGFIKPLQPTPAEVDGWAKAARRYAATHGPQFEAGTVGRIAAVLTRHDAYADQARVYAAEADKLATAAGMPAEHAALVARYDTERAAWAAQPNPPAAGSTWTVTVTGKVTDAKGNPIPDAEVLVNNTQWGRRVAGDEGYKTRTAADGRYTITLKCQGTYRLHVTKVWAEKRGFVRAENTERHKLLPGRSAAIDFTLKPGELFGGTLKVRPDAWERDAGGSKTTHVLRVTGPNVDETVVVENGGTFELTLPPGAYTVELDRGGKKLTWPGLKTGKTDHLFEELPFRFTPEAVGAGFDQMWQSMDRSYSYFALKPEVNWAKLRDEYRPKAARARSADELAAVLKEMLAPLKDGHVWIEMPDGKVVGTHRASWAYNGNRKVVLAQLTDLTECGQYAVVGKTKPDGFGYFLMTRQSAATPELVAKAATAVEKLSAAPGFVIDLRTANGGSEPLAQEIARLFCGKKVAYAKSRFRSGKGHDEFTEDYPRELPPAKSGTAFLKPVVCLLGPGCVSSGEGFAKMLAALPHVTTVGLPTRGSSGNPGPVEVGGTGLAVYFSRWVDLLPDGTPLEGKGVPPAVRVESPAAAYKDADPTLAKGLEVLRAKAAAKQ